jgi:ribose 5-phosphate isomerase A
MSAAAPKPGTERDAFKRAAAEAAVELVQDGMVVGLGTGSTAAFAVEALARRHRQGLHFLGVPTSERTAAQAAAAKIPLTSFRKHRQIDLTIDGAAEASNTFTAHSTPYNRDEIHARRADKRAVSSTS